MSALRDLDILLDPGLTAALEEVARLEWQLASIQAQKRQNAMAAGLRDGRSLEGLGACQRRVDAWAHHDWIAKEGPGVWQDRGFLRYFDRLAPECRVRSRGTKVQVGYSRERRVVIPVRERTAPRFVKSYPPTGNAEEKRGKGEREISVPAPPPLFPSAPFQSVEGEGANL